MNKKKPLDTAEDIQARIDRIAEKFMANKNKPTQTTPLEKDKILSATQAPKHDGIKVKLATALYPIKYSTPQGYFVEYKEWWILRHPNQKWYDCFSPKNKKTA